MDIGCLQGGLRWTLCDSPHLQHLTLPRCLERNNVPMRESLRHGMGRGKRRGGGGGGGGGGGEGEKEVG